METEIILMGRTFLAFQLNENFFIDNKRWEGILGKISSKMHKNIS